MEFTTSTNNTDEFGQAICAFANDLPNHRRPGYLILGVDPQRQLSGHRVKSNLRWMDRIPGVYRDSVLDEHGGPLPTVNDDPYKLALLKHHRSLMSMAMEARKPIFLLKSTDGAIGAHLETVRDCYKDFSRLAEKVAAAAGLPRD